MIELSVVRDLVTIFGVIAALTNKVRKTQLFLSLYEMFESKEAQRTSMKLVLEWEWSDYDDWYSKYGPEINLEAAATLTAFQSRQAKVGLLVKKGMIDIDTVYSMMRTAVVSNWEKYEPITLGIRERMNFPNWMENQEYLYNEIKKIETKRFPELE
jgi:hypothetical protein